MKALIIIQGVNSKPHYLLEGLDPFIEALGYLPTNVHYSCTECVFDKQVNKLPLYFKWLPLEVKDYLSDLWGYFLNSRVKSEINTGLTNTVLRYSRAGYEVDILAHSLGTVIALCLGSNDRKLDLNTFYCLNSPLGLNSVVGRLWVKLKILLSGRNIKFKEICSVYGEKDFISSKMDNSILGIFSSNVMQVKHSGGHSHKESLSNLSEIIPKSFRKKTLQT